MPVKHVYRTIHGIPGWYYCDDFYKKVVEEAEDDARFVEVGLHFGSSSAGMASHITKSGKKIEFFMVDTFEDKPRNYGKEGQKVIRDNYQGNFRKTFEFFRRGAPHEAPFCKLLVVESLEAAKLFDDSSLDMVYLDDDHSCQHVLAELYAWWPKVKAGGMIAMDYDLQNPKSAMEVFSKGEYDIFEDGVLFYVKV